MPFYLEMSKNTTQQRDICMYVYTPLFYVLWCYFTNFL